MKRDNLNEYFFAGFAAGGSVFDGSNPYLWSSPAHMAFEAGKYASHAWNREDIKSAHASRGFSIRLELSKGARAFLKINYDKEHVSAVHE